VVKSAQNGAQRNPWIAASDVPKVELNNLPFAYGKRYLRYLYS
jgi:hypothetical protein